MSEHAAEDKKQPASPDSSPPVASSPASSDKIDISRRPLWRRILMTLNWMPPWCRWVPGQPPRFSIWLNLLFAFAGAFTVANLYYNHPILNILADDFHVSNETVSQVPTLMQAGYAAGLFLLCPLGDMIRRRPFVLTLIFCSATLWIGLCVTNSFTVFRVISLLAAVSTVTPQIMLPLVGDLAPPHKRAIALSIVVSGNLMGILIARILSGIVTQYTSWRNIYWLALGLQYLICLLLWLFMPDYPQTNTGQNYLRILWSVVLMLKKHPVLVQVSLISFSTSACFTSYWTTLTFLLSGSPYHYSTLVIGLFALIGIAGMLLGPIYARLFIDKYVPTVSTVFGILANLIGVAIGTYIGTFTVAGPIIQAFALDAGLQITQIANRSSIYAVEPKGRNRVNTAFMVLTFLGQLTGTSAGNRLYALHGWIASGSLSVALLGFALLLCFVRGPYERGWVGWSGGWSLKKRDMMSADGMTTEAPSGLAKAEPVKAKDAEAGLTNAERGLEEMAGEDGENLVREMNDERDAAEHDSEKRPT